MSSITDAIQDKCLAFSDRIIKLNDYLLEQASQKYDGGSKRCDVRKGKSSFSHQTSDLSQPSSIKHQTSSDCTGGRKMQFDTASQNKLKKKSFISNGTI